MSDNDDNETQGVVFGVLAGVIFGIIALVGLVILLHRRFACDRIAANSTWRDKLLLIWLLVTLLLGLSTIFVSAQQDRKSVV